MPFKYLIPPTPPQIHKLLLLRSTPAGLLVLPISNSKHRSPRHSASGPSTPRTSHVQGAGGLMITWGVKASITRLQAAQPLEEARPELEIGGIIGLTRLWERAYLLVFLPVLSKTEPITLLPSTDIEEFPSLPLETPEERDPDEVLLERLKVGLGLLGSPPDGQRSSIEEEIRKPGLERSNTISSTPGAPKAKAGQGVVNVLKNVYAIPLTESGVEEMFLKLNKSKKPNPPSAPTPEPAPQNTSTTASPSTTSLGSNISAALNPKRWSLPNPLPLLTRTPASQAKPSAVEEENGLLDSREDEGEVDLATPPTPGEQERPTTPRIEEEQIVEVVPRPSNPDQSPLEPVTRVFPSSNSKLDSPTSSASSPPNPQRKTGFQWAKVDKLFAGSGAAIGKGFEDMGKGLGAIARKKPSGVAEKGKGKGEGDGLEMVEGLQPSRKSLEEEDRRLLEDEEPEERPKTVPDGGILVNLPPPPIEEKEKGKVIAAATPPQRKDLEVKIIREIVRELGGGGFFYSFDTDLSHNLQHKRRLIAARTTARSQTSGLLTSLLERDSSTPSLGLGLGSDPSTPADETPRKALAGAAEIDEPEEDPDKGANWIEPDLHLPLWRRFDSKLMWNAFLAKDLIEAGLHEYIIPLMQGWVQSSRFYIPAAPTLALHLPGSTPPAEQERDAEDRDLAPPSIPVDIVLISRRSKERAGLRFQRRGMDEEGSVANAVETEMIIRVKVEEKWNLFSFVIIRGSIPLFWSQASTLSNVKPAPVLDRPVDRSVGVTRLHFDDLKRRYGPQTIVNLAELTGKEGPVTNGFREVVYLLDDADVHYEEFDFHHECKGMHYENISKLINRVENEFSKQGYFWSCQGEVMREQTGTFRVNCIDCLDRTAVVQSAFGRYVLTSQLTQVGIPPDTLTSNIDMVYNDIWANNGDAISRAYAGTSALKGDFTRTGKRDLTGMINDGLNSMARMYSGAVSDFFAQAVISFMVGQRKLVVFSEFLQDLQSSDGTALIRLSRVRAAAIEISSSRVIEEDERRLAGWTFLAPAEANTKYAPSLEEKVVLLTQTALYVVSFNYTLEKVVSSMRIPLRNISSITKGAYILSPLQEAGRDIEENAGFQVFFHPPKEGTRLTSYSVLNQVGSAPNSPMPFTASAPPLMIPSESEQSDLSSLLLASSLHPEGDPDHIDFFAFKALPREFVSYGKADGDDEDEDRGKNETCKELVDRIVKRIKDEVVKSGSRDQDFIKDDDIIGLAEAQKQISLAARMDYAMKRFLWLP